VTYVITQPCIGNKDGSCLEVCPVACIHTDETSEQYFINPAECIDCSACLAACPVEAIMRAEDVPAAQQHFISLNAAFFAA
jgi:ferredoxin